MDSEARFVMLCEAEDGSWEVEPIVLLLRLDKGVVLSTWMILLLLAPFSISLEEIVAELVKPPSVMELWVVKFTTSEELEQAE